MTMSHLLPLCFAVAVKGIAIIVVLTVASLKTPSGLLTGVGAGVPVWPTSQLMLEMSKNGHSARKEGLYIMSCTVSVCYGSAGLSGGSGIQ